tara:strand:+ start:161 stop:1327 length:1167 start_codon:yes stop_codon:yes gene_type:complete
MSNAPIFEINIRKFFENPYPQLKSMREKHPICYVPQLKSTLFTKRNSIAENEKKIDIFSSDQPGGLMTTLMGENMMRKDGESHQIERKAILPSISPKTVKHIWKEQFIKNTEKILTHMKREQKGDLIKDFALPVSAEALKTVTGLSNMTFTEMDRVSQGMIDGIANISGDPTIEANCHNCTKSIDEHINEILPTIKKSPNNTLLSVQYEAGLSEIQNRANIKLAISGGQNEPRDAIAGTVWALLKNKDQLNLILNGQSTWLNAFEEYSRWISPIGMSPRRIAKDYIIEGIKFNKNERIFFMFGSGNRDEDVFDSPEKFNITRKLSASLAFGAGPHFCAGAWISRCLIGEVALPLLFKYFPNIQLDEKYSEVKFAGWAFRGPLRVNCIY